MIGMERYEGIRISKRVYGKSIHKISEETGHARQKGLGGQVLNYQFVERNYPESFTPLPTSEEASKYFSRANEVFQWLINQL